MMSNPPFLLLILFEIISMYSKASGENSIIFWLFEILKPIFFSTFLISIKISRNLGLFDLENLTLL